MPEAPATFSYNSGAWNFIFSVLCKIHVLKYTFIRNLPFGFLLSFLRIGAKFTSKVSQVFVISVGYGI